MSVVLADNICKSLIFMLCPYPDQNHLPNPENVVVHTTICIYYAVNVVKSNYRPKFHVDNRVFAISINVSWVFTMKNFKQNLTGPARFGK